MLGRHPGFCQEQRATESPPRSPPSLTRSPNPSNMVPYYLIAVQHLAWSAVIEGPPLHLPGRKNAEDIPIAESALAQPKEHHRRHRIQSARSVLSQGTACRHEWLIFSKVQPSDWPSSRARAAPLILKPRPSL